MPTGLHIAIAVKVIPLAAIIQPVVLDVATVTVLIPFTRGIALPLTRSGHPDGLERKVADHGGRIKLVSRSISRDPIGKAHARLGGICRLGSEIALVDLLRLNRTPAIAIERDGELLLLRIGIGVGYLAIGRIGIRDGRGKLAAFRFPLSSLAVRRRGIADSGRLECAGRIPGQGQGLSLGLGASVIPGTVFDLVGYRDHVLFRIGSRNRDPLGRKRDVAIDRSIEAVSGTIQLPAVEGVASFGRSGRGLCCVAALIYLLACDSTPAVSIERDGVLGLFDVGVDIGNHAISRVRSGNGGRQRTAFRIPFSRLVVCIRLIAHSRSVGKRRRAILSRLVIGPEQGHRFRHVSGRAIVPGTVHDFIRDDDLILVIDTIAVLIGDTRSLRIFRRVCERRAHGCKRRESNHEREADDKRNRHIDQRLQLRAVQLVERHLFTPRSPDTCSFVI